MDFLVLSRTLAEAFTTDVPYAVISFNTPSYTTLEGEYKPWSEVNIPDSPNLRGILRRTFFDVSVDSEEYPAMTEEDAKAVAEFVLEHKDHVKLFVVHCQAGLCRSPGAAAAISKWIQGDDEFFYKNYRPNSLVYRKVYDQLLELEDNEN